MPSGNFLAVVKGHLDFIQDGETGASLIFIFFPEPGEKNHLHICRLAMKQLSDKNSCLCPALANLLTLALNAKVFIQPMRTPVLKLIFPSTSLPKSVSE